MPVFFRKKIPYNYIFTNQSMSKLIIPLIIEQTLAVSVGMFDTIMISSVGEAAMSGVSLVDMINQLFIGLFAALGTGGAVICSQFIGAGDKKRACMSAHQLYVFVAIFSLAMTAFCMPLRKAIFMRFFGKIEDDVLASAMTYFTITAISFVFLGVFNGCAALFRSMGNSKVPMFLSLMVNLVNITGNAVLIYVFRMGVAGAAISTLFSRILGAVVITLLISDKSRMLFINFKQRLRFNGRILKKILHIGIPSAFENSLFQFGKLITGGIISSFGTMHVAANAVAVNFCSIACIPGSAMGLAMLTVVGQCVGAGSEEQTRFFVKWTLKKAYIYNGAINVMLAASLPLLLKMYNISGETASLAYELTMIHACFAILIWPVSFSFPNALRASNNVTYTMTVSVLSMLVFRIAFSYILAYNFGLKTAGVYFAMIIDWTVRSIAFIVFYLSGRWRKRANFRVQ
ncbi:MAG: MATE family efflux transporter [Firmicutes bacterium]|nr:MATE family efflux transporter [Bacillota bacterium]